ncbi:unnamed protein product [Rhizophagus irregularis]|nr:unnamed protein product [Rhizophagus irregularis]
MINSIMEDMMVGFHLGQNMNILYKRSLDILDDIIIFGSLHAMNIYLFFTWWKYESIVTKVFGIIAFFYLFLFLYHAIIHISALEIIARKHMEVGESFMYLVGEKARICILLITAVLFLMSPNSLKLSDAFDKFCTNEYSYKDCMTDRLLRWITVFILVVAWILFLSIRRKRPNENLWSFRKFGIFIFFMSAILIQAVGNGLLLSNNFWQTKVTTALTIVAIVRLIDIYKNGGSSLYASIFWERDEKEGDIVEIV